jgi:hypothetical protein
LRCTFFPRLLCASLLSPLSIAVSRAFLVLFINYGACWLWFGVLPSKLFSQVHSEYFFSVAFLVSKSSFCVRGSCSRGIRLGV